MRTIVFFTEVWLQLPLAVTPTQLTSRWVSGSTLQMEGHHVRPQLMYHMNPLVVSKTSISDE